MHRRERAGLAGSRGVVDLAIGDHHGDKDLEEEVGATLFSRSQQGMELTTTGREMLFHAYQVLAKVDEMSGISVPGSDLEGALRVAASYTVIGCYLWSKTPYRPSVQLRTSSVEAVRSIVANGQGVAILSDMVHRPWALEGRRIETIELSDPIPAMDVGLAWKRGSPFTPAMQAFRNYFRQTYRMPMGRQWKPGSHLAGLGPS